MESFEVELVGLLNRHAIQRRVSLPAEVLCRYVVGCLGLLEDVRAGREAWLVGDVCVSRPVPVGPEVEDVDACEGYVWHGGEWRLKAESEEGA